LNRSKKGVQSLKVDIDDRPISTVLVVVYCVGMVWKVIVPDDGFPGCVPILHRVFDTLWIAVGRGDAIGSYFGESVTEVPRDVDDLLHIVPGHRC